MRRAQSRCLSLRHLGRECTQSVRLRGAQALCPVQSVVNFVDGLRELRSVTTVQRTHLHDFQLHLTGHKPPLPPQQPVSASVAVLRRIFTESSEWTSGRQVR